MRKILKFQYYMEIRFSNPIINHSYAVKCTPKDTMRQRITELRINIGPCEGRLGENDDIFGNHIYYGDMREPHNNFYISVKGSASTSVSDRREEPLNRQALGFYKYASKHTKPGPCIKAYLKELIARNPQYDTLTALARAEYFMKELYQDFSYVSGVTDIGTSAEEALKIRQGVCQDYAHIMIALCRLAGIPARYVVGFMIGEGYSHAWIEVAHENYWYGLDPTNNLWIDANYVKVTSGRDYADCIIDKGSFVGEAVQEQKIHVKVSEEK